MLATPHSAHLSMYRPARPSPLSPRSANAYAVAPIPGLLFGMSKQETNPFGHPQTSSIPFSQRAIKSNPFARRTKESERERRRDLFLRRVEKTRDDKRWEGRSEQILRSDYVAERRRWEEEKSKSAPDSFSDWSISDPEDDEMMTSQELNTNGLPSSSGMLTEGPPNYIDEVEMVARQEQMELEALVELAERSSNPSQTPAPSSPLTNYDDEEYDNIFMEYISEEDQIQSEPAQDEDMDMSQ